MLRGNGVGRGGQGGAGEGASCRTFQEPKPIPSGSWRVRAAGGPRVTWPHQAGGTVGSSPTTPKCIFCLPEGFLCLERRGPPTPSKGGHVGVVEREDVKRLQSPIRDLES